MSMFVNDREALRVAQLNELIRGVLNAGFPDAVWVCGEVQGYDRNKDKKHVFFELCDKSPDGSEITARAQLVIFAGKKLLIDEVLKRSENAFSLKDDIEVKLLCRVDFYPPHGAVRLIVENIDPVYTLGKIAQDRQKLILELKKKGTLDQNKTVVLSEVPLNIGLITAYDSAAYNDFLDELRKSGYSFKVFFVNSLMQGNGAQQSVARAIETLNRVDQLEAIVVTRGGGSIAELSCFDSRNIAERIAASALPVLSGIGHEINVTVTDLAAHTYAKTPTAIAGFLVQRVSDFLAEIELKGAAISEKSQTLLQEQRTRLREGALGLQQYVSTYLKGHHERLFGFSQTIKRVPVKRLMDESKIVLGLGSNLVKRAEVSLKNARGTVQNYAKVVEIVSPQNTLRRGFSITRDRQGRAIRSVGEISIGVVTVTQVLDGVLKSRVEETIREEMHG